MTKQLFFAFLFSTLLFTGWSQEILLDEVVEPDTAIDNFAPDGKHYFTMGVGLGFAAGPDGGPNGAVDHGKSTDFKLTASYRRLFGQRFGLGARLVYFNQNFTLEQNTFDRERLILNSLNLEGYFRIVLAPKSGKNGWFLDGGAFGTWIPGARVHQESNLPNNPFTAEQEVIFRDLSFVEDFGYGVSARFGVNSYALYARYRISDMFSPITDPAALSMPNGLLFDELPRLTIGLEIGL